jgi:hypothetical protein
MPISRMKVGRWMLGAIVGVACLFIGDGASSTRGSVIVQAYARAERPLPPPKVAGVARRTHHRALLDRTIPFNFGYSAGGATFYGYAPGTYGGLGCYNGHGGLVCP